MYSLMCYVFIHMLYIYVINKINKFKRRGIENLRYALKNVNKETLK